MCGNDACFIDKHSELVEPGADFFLGEVFHETVGLVDAVGAVHDGSVFAFCAFGKGATCLFEIESDGHVGIIT